MAISYFYITPAVLNAALSVTPFTFSLPVKLFELAFFGSF